VQRSQTQASGRAWGWLAAVLDGAGTPWAEWTDSAGAAEPRLPFFQAAQQLEALRRLNLAAAATGRSVSPDLARSLLVGGITDRNRGDLRLVGEAEVSFGPPAVRPSDLPAGDLLAVVAGPLARRLAALPEPPSRTPLPLVRGLRIVGDPWAGAHLRAQQEANRRGRVGRRTLVLAADFGTLALHAWAHQAVSGGLLGPRDWLDSRVHGGPPPSALDLAGQAQRAAREVGVRRVRLVIGPQRIGGLRPAPTLDPTAVELARWVGRPLGLLLTQTRKRALLTDSLVPWATRDTGPLAIPEPWHAHLTAYAERQRSLLGAAGYPVLGSLDGLLPASVVPSAFPTDADVLARALDLLLDPQEGVSR
jgi:hypothetical protein